MSGSVLVTGASGFVGSALCSSLLAQGYRVRAALRSADSMPSAQDLDVFAVGDVGAQTDWSAALTAVDCVIHCAARAHVMHENEGAAAATYRAVNVEGTQRLAEQAVALGVRRLVFLSSIKVNGEQTALGAPFLFSDVPAPEDPYGVSKWEAEQALWVVSAQTGLEVVVVRPPLVYGPRVKGNLLRLLKLLRLGIPLPFDRFKNQRSLIGLDNLVDVLMLCVHHPAAAGKTFLVADGQDLSTSDLIRQMASAMGKKAYLLPLPIYMLKMAGYIFRRQRDVEKLVGSLQISSRYVQETLNWMPKKTVESGIRGMVCSFIAEHEGKKK